MPERWAAPARYALRTAMKNSAFLALLAGLAIGCAPSSTPGDAGTAEKNDDTKVAQNDTSAGQGQAESSVPEAVSNDQLEPKAPTDGEKKPETQGTQPSAPPQGGQQPGGRQGGFGGRRGGGFNIAMMLGNEQVRALIQKELSLTDDQVTKLQALAPQPGGGQQDMTDEERAKQREELQKKINDVLNPAQEQRVKEIQLQVRGTRALTSDEVVKELGLSAKQVADIEAALDVPRPQQQQGGAQPSDEERQKMMAEFQKAREAANAKALAVLTPAQKAKWEKMLGKKFEMPMMGGFGGGRPGGARPGGGGAAI